MAPLHHHFELRSSDAPNDYINTLISNQEGLKESTIVVRFWIISFIFAIVGLIQFLY